MTCSTVSEVSRRSWSEQLAVDQRRPTVRTQYLLRPPTQAKLRSRGQVLERYCSIRSRPCLDSRCTAVAQQASAAVLTWYRPALELLEVPETQSPIVPIERFCVSLPAHSPSITLQGAARCWNGAASCTLTVLYESCPWWCRRRPSLHLLDETVSLNCQLCCSRLSSSSISCRRS